MGSSSWRRRRSTVTPVWPATASTMSAAVTDPKRRPAAPARGGSRVTPGGRRRATSPTAVAWRAAAAAPRPSLVHGPLGVGQKGQLTGGLDGHRHVALVLRAVARHPPGPDLAPVGHEPAQEVDVLVVHPLDVFFAEDTDLLLDPPPGVLGRAAPFALAVAVAGHQKGSSP